MFKRLIAVICWAILTAFAALEIILTITLIALALLFYLICWIPCGDSKYNLGVQIENLLDCLELDVGKPWCFQLNSKLIKWCLD